MINRSITKAIIGCALLQAGGTLAAEKHLAEPVHDRLAVEYPFDKAIGYTVGQVWGAVTIKRPL